MGALHSKAASRHQALAVANSNRAQPAPRNVTPTI